MRGIAILGVIWLHAANVLPEGIGLTAVPYFVIMAVIMTGRSLSKRPDESAGSYIGKRFIRLYPAFLFWCVIYESIRQLKLIKEGGLSNIQIDWLGFIGGTYEHLWFLPFLLISTILVVPIVKITAHHSLLRKVVSIITLLLAATVAVLPVPREVEALKLPWLWIRASYWAIPSLLIGISMMTAMIDAKLDLKVPKFLGIVGLITLIFATILQWRSVDPWLPAATYGGLGAAWLAMSGIGKPVLKYFTALGGMSLGIYLSHVVFLRVLVMVLDKKQIAVSPATDIAGFFFALAGGFITTWILSKSKFTRWTVGG